MDDRQPSDAPAPNAVLRGGPFDGELIHVTTQVPVVRHAGKVRHVYQSTQELDQEYPTLVIYVHKHTLVY
ncbi:hypothetical protein KDL01_27660 [Actinospica durhamensis]|uniref:Uncharacterized protein n=1 Tax=Actinospica durhamensis TaxID=1508375 RepID=A0A941ET42_9ACTN|nr:hypothetical protein [Actinospica durhamensis]MBR7837085.1 hypothetical protein [Actinospica durhamensis]